MVDAVEVVDDLLNAGLKSSATHFRDDPFNHYLTKLFPAMTYRDASSPKINGLCIIGLERTLGFRPDRARFSSPVP